MIGQPVQLVTKRPQPDEEKFEKVVEMLLERSNNRVLGEMRAMNRSLERSVNRLLENLDAVVRGDKDVAVAGVVDGEADDLPRLSRVKAEATMLYSLKTGAIASRLGLTTMRVSFLLNKSGLDWVGRKPELWGDDFYDISSTRLWHPKTVGMLRDVMNDPRHPERKHATDACKRYLKKLDAKRAG